MRYLTKSRFKLARECPRKLYYVNKEEYINKNDSDLFLASLAANGIQVGELAKIYYGNGLTVETFDSTEALNETNKLLKKEQVIIYEAAFLYQDLFIRVDILIKEGKNIKLFEVKSKTIDKNFDLISKRPKGAIKADWLPYVEDIIYQYFVASQAMPEYNFIPGLLLVNKDTTFHQDGLNQQIKVDKRGFKTKVVVSADLKKSDIPNDFFSELDVSNLIDVIINKNKYLLEEKELSFEDYVFKLAKYYKEDKPLIPNISKAYKDYEFYATKEEIDLGYKSGFHESLKDKFEFSDEDLKEDLIFSLWFGNTDKLLSKGYIKLKDIPKEEFKLDKYNKGAGLNRAQRQWLQIEKVNNNDNTYWIDEVGLRNEISTWNYPLHFIDFETSSPTISFIKGKKPNQDISFQFSHHIVDKEGKVEHKSEYINTSPGVDPNIELVRELKRSLSDDNGTIFRYDIHENSILLSILNEINDSDTDDKKELIEFIEDITESGNQVGKRNMVDLKMLVQLYYYDPVTKGSISIKEVLPAILNSSRFIQNKYSKPIYGSDHGIRSLNFKDMVWVRFNEDGSVKDPYQLLPKILTDIKDEENDNLALSNELNNGVAALMAYNRLQHDNRDNIRKEIEAALLRYCELDTLAMVMIYEAWIDMLK